jgi:biofilm PGA synthesis N-glycosyltransferase PgaC
MSGSRLLRGIDNASSLFGPRRPMAAGGHDTAVAVLVGPQVAPAPPVPGDRPGMASIVVPTHNDGPNMAVLLARLLDEPEVGEILVIASACDDETVPTVLEVAERSGGRVRLYIEAERSGKAAAVNFGLGEVTQRYAVIVSGDVLPEPGAIGHLVKALGAPGVGLAGGRPLPVNPTDSAIGHAVHLLWRLHHRLALHQPKLGEMLALRSEAIVTLPRTSVDEACFQALLESTGWRSAYVPEAVVANRGPCSRQDFLKQRRQIHAGHLWLRHRHQYTVPSLRPTLLLVEIWKDVRAEPEGTSPRRLAWTAGAVAMEAYARARARLDYMQGRENHVWDMVASTKAPALDTDGLFAGRGELLEGPRVAPTAAGQRHGQHQLPV